MTRNRYRDEVRRTIQAVLARDCACPAQTVVDDGVLVTAAKEMPGRRPFPFLAKPLLVATMGAGVAVSCHPARIARLCAALEALDRDAIVSAPTITRLARYVARDRQALIGPEPKYACSSEDLRPASIPPGVEIAAVGAAGLTDLYRHPGFDHALSYRSHRNPPDVLATVARRGVEVVGIAGAGADSAALWQIGVDVVPAVRGQGIGRALVGQLTGEVLRRGKIPYYTASVSNIASGSLAVGLGYWPAWTELRARDYPPDAGTS